MNGEIYISERCVMERQIGKEKTKTNGIRGKQRKGMNQRRRSEGEKRKKTETALSANVTGVQTFFFK